MGPMGAVLAVPLTLFAHAVLVGQDPDRAWARTLLAGTSGSSGNSAPRRRRSRSRSTDRHGNATAPPERDVEPDDAEPRPADQEERVVP